MQRTAILVACALGALLLTSCQATRSWQDGCPGVYSGARYYSDITPTVPLDGKLFFTLDLIPTLVLDTLAIPVTAFVKREKPTGGYVVGCRWADPRRMR